MKIGLILAVLALFLVIGQGFVFRDRSGVALHLGGDTFVHRTWAESSNDTTWNIRCLEVEEHCLRRGELLCPEGFLVVIRSQRYVRYVMARVPGVEQREISLVIDCRSRG